MTEQAKVPAIRFAGFTDPWEQRKFRGVPNLDELDLFTRACSVNGENGTRHVIAMILVDISGMTIANEGYACAYRRFVVQISGHFAKVIHIRSTRRHNVACAYTAFRAKTNIAFMHPIWRGPRFLSGDISLPMHITDSFFWDLRRGNGAFALQWPH